MWAGVCLHNGAKGEVVYFIYKNEAGPRSGNLTEAVVVQFSVLYDILKHFFQRYLLLFQYQLYVVNEKSQVVTVLF